MLIHGRGKRRRTFQCEAGIGRHVLASQLSSVDNVHSSELFGIHQEVSGREVLGDTEPVECYSFALMGSGREDSKLRLIGPATVVDVQVEGMSAKALLDTGSVVSTISEGFLQAEAAHVRVQPLETLVRITSSTGHQLPYAGLVELQVQFVDQFGIDRDEGVLALVVPDNAWNCDVPVLLGTNVLTTKDETGL